MKLSQLIAQLIDLEIEHGESSVILEVGGDGAIHQGSEPIAEVRTLPLHSDNPISECVYLTSEGS